jgi:glycosyltransferase involved in cell wall biosynthesis
MHDMWPVTGICHHARECDHFTKACGQCFFLQSKKDKDLSSKIVMRKKKCIFSYHHITFVACSQWLADKAKISGLSRNHHIISISNPIDVTQFKILDKAASRDKFGLPKDRKLLLFGAVNITDKRKGFDYLIDALDVLVSRHVHTELCVIVFGQVKPGFTDSMQIPIFKMGYMRNQNDMVALYNAVDLYVTPSLEENLPNTIMEAMACGTPCVGFNTGGIPEMIDHKQNGYVAAYKNAADLADGIQWVLHVADYNELSNHARKKVESTYSEAIVAKQYIEIYELLKKHQ